MPENVYNKEAEFLARYWREIFKTECQRKALPEEEPQTNIAKSGKNLRDAIKKNFVNRRPGGFPSWKSGARDALNAYEKDTEFQQSFALLDASYWEEVEEYIRYEYNILDIHSSDVDGEPTIQDLFIIGFHSLYKNVLEIEGIERLTSDAIEAQSATNRAIDSTAEAAAFELVCRSLVEKLERQRDEQCKAVLDTIDFESSSIVVPSALALAGVAFPPLFLGGTIAAVGTLLHESNRLDNIDTVRTAIKKDFQKLYKPHLDTISKIQKKSGSFLEKLVQLTPYIDDSYEIAPKLQISDTEWRGKITQLEELLHHIHGDHVSSKPKWGQRSSMEIVALYGKITTAKDWIEKVWGEDIKAKRVSASEVWSYDSGLTHAVKDEFGSTANLFPSNADIRKRREELTEQLMTLGPLKI